MKKVAKLLDDQRGVTLIELLASMVIFTIIIGVSYHVLINGLKIYKNVETEVQLRDEADIIMSQFMNHLYAAYEGANHPVKSMIQVKKMLDTDTTEFIELGFDDGHAVINGTEIQSDNISLSGSSIQILADNTVKIVLIVTNEQKPSKSLELRSDIKLHLN